MIGSDIKLLFRKLNSQATTALYNAVGLAVERSHYEVAFEHVLMKAIDVAGTDIFIVLDYFKVDRPKLKQSLAKALESFNSGNTGKPTFSPVLQELLEASWLASSVDFGLASIRSGAILVSYLRRPSLFSQGGPLPELGKISRDELEKGFFKILAQSLETGEEPAGNEETSQPAMAGSAESFTSKFCENFTDKAAKGKIDPVFGRDDEIRSMINILARRRKNNPILVGEPGVGKTAVIEGLAMRVYEGDVPETLKGVTILGLDMGLLEAGASVKGEFERRLKGIIDEIKASPKQIILFIDEAHMLVGAGGQAGGSDAANLLKPALARGELKTCAATTWKEYKKYFEKDPALARRFQLVTLGEPDVPTCVLILRGLRDYYEKSHGVSIRDEAIVTAAEMSNRYISGRFLPDKAVDLIDTACARVKVGLVAKPKPLEEAERDKAALGRERQGLAHDSAFGDTPGITARLKKIATKEAELTTKIGELSDNWAKQKEAAQALRKAKIDFLEAKETTDKISIPASEEAAPEGYQPPDKARAPEKAMAENRASARAEGLESASKALGVALENFSKTASPYGQIDLEVTSDVVAAIVSDWTGIPVGRLAAEQAQVVSGLETLLQQRIKGQADALSAITKVIQASKAGLRDPQQPIGVFLLVGPSGVGKTETGLALADIMFGDSSNVITINMSEFQERHTVSRLVGSPPGYVGYGEGGLLTEAVSQKPYCVVLLDEVEKAHIDVLNLFYQVFDKGVLTDSEGKKVNFANTVMLLTSNLASAQIEQEFGKDPAQGLDSLAAAIRPILSGHFQPALLARMTVVPYRPLGHEAMCLIARLKLEALAKRIRKNNNVSFVYADEVVGAIADRCLTTETGARNIDYVLSSSIMPQMAQELLAHMTSGQPMPKAITLALGEGKSFSLSTESGESVD
ncbi:MAG: type VI secretion system ATPase TssH [Deltaproteobacteria bacterium]|jgi:type VI secretion system protein VasG|nr:type VI secretion system ATPase TssH [Deltaproteobacteria bacterium]